MKRAFAEALARAGWQMLELVWLRGGQPTTEVLKPCLIASGPNPKKTTGMVMLWNAVLLSLGVCLFRLFQAASKGKSD